MSPSADTSKHLPPRQLKLLQFDLDVVHGARIKHEAPYKLFTVETEETDKKDLDEKLLALIADAIEEQYALQMEHLDQDQPWKGKNREAHGRTWEEIQFPTSESLLDTQAKGRITVR